MNKLAAFSLMASLFLSFHQPIYASTQAETERALFDTSKKLSALEAKHEALANIVHILVKYGNNSNGLSSLCCAAKKGDMDALITLIENGADVKAQSWQTGCNNEERITSTLSEAIKANNIEMVKILIEFGSLCDCDCNNFESEYEPNPLMFAINNDSLEVFNVLMQNKECFNYAIRDRHLLNRVISYHRYDLVVALVEAGVDVNEPNKQYNSPLECAAYHSYAENPISLDIVRYLVEHGAIRSNVHYNLNCKVISAYLESVGK